jgi:dihydroorotate dehydrogenase
VKRFADVADYLTMNISSPNTKGLRDLQSNEALKRLLGETLAERARAKIFVPVFLKIAPDLDEKELDEIAQLVQQSDLDGLIISNTTISRDMIENEENSNEKGGLSGKPLFNLSTQKLAQMRQRVGVDLPIIGVGGIHSAKSAIAKLNAGANAIQLYSALVYEGMDLLDEIKAGLTKEVNRAGVENVSDLVGTKTDDWASGKGKI